MSQRTRPARRLAARLLPSPWLSLGLALMWPVLNQSASLGQWLLGIGLAVAIPWFTHGLREQPLHPRRASVAARLALVVLRDIVVSNFSVARRILGREAALQPRFVWVPLELDDPHGIVALAAIITLTPGTVSADLSPDRRHLLIHALDVDDEAALVADIKTRYEAPLREIFE